MRRLVLLMLTLLAMLPCAAGAEIIINEVMASNGTYENGHAYDWVELYNSGKKQVDLSGWHLSDSKKNPEKFTFPKGASLKAGGYLTVFCTGDDTLGAGSGSKFYAPFKVSSGGETLYLTSAGGETVQKLELPPQYGTVSYGLPAGSGAYGFLATDTRGKKNPDVAYALRAQKPVLLTSGGFYDERVTVLAQGAEGATLRYTTNGATPTEKSPVFPADGLNADQTTVLRVRAFREDAVPSETVSATYFIADTLVTPVVSLITDEKYLFDKKTGALVKGTGSIPNYDKELEYPVNIEYFSGEGLCEINQMGTFTCSGHSARINAQKSIALYARGAWGGDRFVFNPFPTRDYDSYKSVLLRAANSDAYATRLRDVIASGLAEGEGILYQDAQMIQVYINGEYWGHYNLREKINKYFIAQYEGVTDEDTIDRIDILARTGRDAFVQNGSNADWLALCDFCKTKDLNDPDNLAWVEERLDIDSLFTHAAYEIILGNVDITNVRVYRVPGGKWRYLLFDVEACWRGLDATPIEYYIKPVSAKINGFRHEPLNALLDVPEYRARFLRRVAELLETRFRWDDVEAEITAWTEQLAEILPRHIARWKNMKYSDWETNIGAISYYARVRPKKIPALLQKAMKLTNDEVELYFGEALTLLEEVNTK